MTQIRASLPEGVLGMACMVAAMGLLPMGDTLSKLLTGEIGPVEVTMWRLVAQALCLVPVALLQGRHGRRGRGGGGMFAPVVALSGGLIMVALVCLISAFAAMPIATAIAIFFVEPLVLTLLTGPLLGERVGPRRLGAVAVGLLGALLVIRPGFSAHGWATLLPLGAATAYALNMIVLRVACRTRSGLDVQCGATAYAALGMVAVVGAMHAAGVARVAPGTYPGWVWAAVAGAGVLAAVAFVLIAEAFRRAEAGALAPFQYLEIVGATAMGWLVFDDFPDLLTWAGIAVILASGLYVFHREGRAADR